MLICQKKKLQCTVCKTSKTRDAAARSAPQTSRAPKPTAKTKPTTWPAQTGVAESPAPEARLFVEFEPEFAGGVDVAEPPGEPPVPDAVGETDPVEDTPALLEGGSGTEIFSTKVALCFELSRKSSSLAQLGSLEDLSLSAVQRRNMALLAQILVPSLTTPPPALVHDTKSCVTVRAIISKKLFMPASLPDPKQVRHWSIHPYQPSGLPLGRQMHSRVLALGPLSFWHSVHFETILSQGVHSVSLLGPSGAVICFEGWPGPPALTPGRKTASDAAAKRIGRNMLT